VNVVSRVCGMFSFHLLACSRASRTHRRHSGGRHITPLTFIRHNRAYRSARLPLRAGTVRAPRISAPRISSLFAHARCVRTCRCHACYARCALFDLRCRRGCSLEISTWNRPSFCAHYAMLPSSCLTAFCLSDFIAAAPSFCVHHRSAARAATLRASSMVVGSDRRSISVRNMDVCMRWRCCVSRASRIDAYAGTRRAPRAFTLHISLHARTDDLH